MGKTITVSAAERDAAAAAAAAEDRANELNARLSSLLDAYAYSSEGLSLTEEADLLHSLIYGVDAATRMRAINRLTYTVGSEEGSTLGEATEAVFRCGGVEYRVTKIAAKPEVSGECDEVTIHDRNGAAWKKYAYSETAATVPSMLNNIRLSMGNAARLVAESANAERRETKSESKPRKSAAPDPAVEALAAKLAESERKRDEQFEMIKAMLAARG